MNTATAAAFSSDDDLIAALEASPNFTTVTDADHLAEIFNIDLPSQVNGYTVIGTVEAKHVWRAAGAYATKVAYQTGGVHAVTGAPRWAEVKRGQDVTGLDLYEIV